MSIADLLPLPVVAPLTGGLLAPLVARVNRRAALVVGVAAMVAALALLCLEAPDVYGGRGAVLSHYLSNERPFSGGSGSVGSSGSSGSKALGIAFAADPFGMTFALLTAVIGLLLLVSALSELGELGAKELGGLAALMQLLLAALIGAALTADTVNLFVWFEVAALASYGLTGFFLERPIALEAAFKNLVMTSTAGFAVFVGAAMLYRSSGGLNFGQLQNTLPSQPPTGQLLAVSLLVAGFATKSGLMPFHGWLPDAHTPVPGAVSALFSALMVDLGIVGLCRLSLVLFPQTHRLAGLLACIGCVSALAGALLTLVQDDLKRLLAWDTVSQMGVLIIGFASHTAEGVAGAVYHLVNHGMFKALLFLCAGAVVHSTGKTHLSEMGGLARTRPLLAAGFVVGALAIAGVPPLNGYFSVGLIHTGVEDQPGVFAVALLAQTITVAALARAAYLAFFRRRDEPYDDLQRPRAGMVVSLAALAAGCVTFGILAQPFISHVAAPAASTLLHPRAYATGVLNGHAAVPALEVSFEYGDLKDLLITAAEIVVGLAIAVVSVRRAIPRPLQWLRALHTGSVNDYAAYLIGGLVLTGYVLIT